MTDLDEMGGELRALADLFEHYPRHNRADAIRAAVSDIDAVDGFLDAIVPRWRAMSRRSVLGDIGPEMVRLHRLAKMIPADFEERLRLLMPPGSTIGDVFDEVVVLRSRVAAAGLDC